jgi:hypothetical protein
MDGRSLAHSELGSFTKVKMKNRISMMGHWLDTTYFISQGDLSKITEVEIDGVRYPVFSKMVYERVDVHGHEFSSWVKHFFVQVELFGTTFELDLKMILGKVAVFATEFEISTVEK